MERRREDKSEDKARDENSNNPPAPKFCGNVPATCLALSHPVPNPRRTRDASAEYARTWTSAGLSALTASCTRSSAFAKQTMAAMKPDVE